MLKIADKAKAANPDGDLEMDTVEALFQAAEHELRPSQIELRTLRYIFNTYSFRQDAKQEMEKRCGLGPDEGIM